MTALTLTARYAAPSREEGAAATWGEAHLMGASLPAFLRTVGALAALLLAVAVTGVILVAFAVVMPFALLGALVMRRLQPRSERRGWRPAPA